MAVPSRREFYQETVAKIPDAMVFEDDGTYKMYQNSRRALLSFQEKPFHLVLQDDVILCDGFVEILDKICEAMIREKNALPVGLYCPMSIVNKITTPYMAMVGGTWGVANMFPTHLINDMDRHGVESFIPSFYSMDARWTLWSMDRQIPVLITVPSLVQHRAEIKSTGGRDNKNRVAARFATPEDNLLNRSWSTAFSVRKPYSSLKTYAKRWVKFLTPQTRTRIFGDNDNEHEAADE